MIKKFREKERAIKLRRKGFSYNEILKEIPVAKSTLSLWLRDIGLAKKQKQRLTEKKLAAAKRGYEARRRQRLLLTQKIQEEVQKEIKNINERELWLIGIALYWAEGAKQKENNVSQKVRFSYSDPKMIRIFLKWLQDICKIPREDIYLRISLHRSATSRLAKVKKYWVEITKFPINHFQKIYWKKNKINTKRKNIGKEYFGLLDISVKRSTNFNRKIMGWIEGICKNCGVVQR